MRRLLLFIFLICSQNIMSALVLPSVFSDHMVLQQQRPLPIWGKAAAGATVEVTFRDCHVTVEVSAEGRWQATLEPQEASFEPAQLVVTDGRQTLRFNDVLVGEVWLCSGQSNMQWPLHQVKDGDLEMLAANHPAMRLFTVPNVTSQEPLFTCEADWQICSEQTVGVFSAVGYYFGRDLRQVLEVPVGLIDASWGGTPAIAWTREQVFEQHPLLVERKAEWDDIVANYPQRYAQWQEEIEEWKAGEREVIIFHEDPGVADECREFHLPQLDDRAWETVFLPSNWDETIAVFDGAVWFRQEFDLPEAMRGQPLTFSSGPIDDFDKIWVNGTYIGGIDDVALSPWEMAREYPIPAEATTGPTLSIAIRIFDRFGGGGLLGTPRQFKVSAENGDSIGLAGDWKYFIESRLEPAYGPAALASAGAPPEPPSPNSPHRPACLANGMLATVAPYAVRGTIWYQGESDAGWEPSAYGERLRVMLEDWRQWWQIEDMPVGIVQLANYLEPKAEPSNDPWPRLRESQRQLVQAMPHTGLAVAIDIGEADDIHPRNKQEVGRRLSRWALADVYGQLTLRGGPELESAMFEGAVVRLKFRSTGTGLKALNGFKLRGFTLAGADGAFYHAEAVIENPTTLAVSSGAVAEPVHVRYAWQNNPAEANLGNQERLPASPFEVRRED